MVSSTANSLLAFQERQLEELTQKTAAHKVDGNDVSAEAIKIANAFLDELEKNPIRIEAKKLDSETARNIGDGLRLLFPYESIRQRLEYERKSVKNFNSPKEPESNRKLIWTQSRKQSLIALHSVNVEGFVNTNGNGLSRIPVPSPRMLRLPNYGDQDPGKMKFITGEKKHWKDAATKVHQMLSSSFTRSSVETDIKSLDEVAGFEPHRLDMKFEVIRYSLDNQTKHSRLGAIASKTKTNVFGTKMDDTKWKMKRLQLISLLKHDKPRVYKHEGVPDMEKLMEKDFATRSLNAFESGALKKLFRKENVVINEGMGHIAMLGAIRARRDCMNCHAVKEGDLLGAFSYEFNVVK